LHGKNPGKSGKIAGRKQIGIADRNFDFFRRFCPSSKKAKEAGKSSVREHKSLSFLAFSGCTTRPGALFTSNQRKISLQTPQKQAKYLKCMQSYNSLARLILSSVKKWQESSNRYLNTDAVKITGTFTNDLIPNP
jgi:hypothetical protein